MYGLYYDLSPNVKPTSLYYNSMMIKTDAKTKEFLAEYKQNYSDAYL